MHSIETEELHPFSPRYESKVTAWHSHRLFAYSLIKKHRPSAIVELGVHYGDSYFTFCQACEELEIDAQCFGMDLWRENEQGNSHVDEVFDHINFYNNEFYNSFSTLLRMNFEDALSKFEDQSIDFLHIDGTTAPKNLERDYHDWLPKVRDGGLILLHGINVKKKDFDQSNFWNEMKDLHFTKEDLGGCGLGVIYKIPPKKETKESSRPFFIEHRLPSSQNAVEIFKGSWASKFPEKIKLLAGGTAKCFEDDKLIWAIQQMGGVRGKKGLELGPLEGGHSYMLQKAGVKSLTAIESNSNAFQKCLVTKEVFKLDKVNFLFGDFQKYLRETKYNYDFILASGVLYHLKNPIDFLESILDKSNSFFVWTHFYEEGLRKSLPEQFSEEYEIKYARKTYLASKHLYNESNQLNTFWGGIEDHSVWLEKKLILNIFQKNGFETQIFNIEKKHPNGPCFSFLAKK